MTNITISKPEPSDQTEWQQLYRLYAGFYQMPMPLETLNQVWQWITDPHEDFHCLVARDEQKGLIGLMHFRGMPSPLRGAKVGFLDDFYVVESARGQGVSDKLFEALKAQAKDKEWAFVRWITAEDNARARGFYQKHSQQTPWLTYQLSP